MLWRGESVFERRVRWNSNRMYRQERRFRYIDIKGWVKLDRFAIGNTTMEMSVTKGEWSDITQPYDII